jgi:HEAT repeat protein
MDIGRFRVLPAVAFVLLALSFLCVSPAQAIPPDDTPRLLEQLQSDDPDARDYAAKVLAQRKEPRAVQPLIEILGDSNSGFLASECLQYMGDTAIDALYRALHHDNADVRRSAVALLLTMDQERAAAILAEMAVTDSDFNVRLACLTSLERTGKVPEDVLLLRQ